MLHALLSQLRLRRSTVWWWLQMVCTFFIRALCVIRTRCFIRALCLIRTHFIRVLCVIRAVSFIRPHCFFRALCFILLSLPQS